MKLHYKLMDVFTSVPFKGNPLAVVYDADRLSSETMQQIAKWMNLSETSFFQIPKVGDYKLRIFTPKKEIPFAGHPTVGSAFAAWQSGLISPWKNIFFQECEAGLVRLLKENNTIYAEVPYAKILDIKIDCKKYNEALGCEITDDPVVIDTGPLWAVANVKQLSTLRNLKINLDKISRLSEKSGITGLTVYCFVPGKGVYLRTFAPLIGIPEDPVCGSGNAAVAAHIRLTGKKEIFGDSFTSFQGEALGRNGLVKISYDNEKILIGGSAVKVVEGIIIV